jgi:hypothetical protein
VPAKAIASPESLVTAAGPEAIDVSGARVSTVQWRTAADVSEYVMPSPKGLMPAATESAWAPSASGPRSALHATGLPSNSHW